MVGNEMTLIWLISVAVSERRRLRGKPVSKKGRHDRLSFAAGKCVVIGLEMLLVGSLVSIDIGRDSISRKVCDL